MSDSSAPPNKAERVAAHTPGPWIANGGEILAGTDPYSRSRTPSERVRIASVGASKLAPESVEESAANARLIAAAPDLLAACKVLVASERSEYGSANWLAAVLVATERARDAIAKAEGGGE